MGAIKPESGAPFNAKDAGGPFGWWYVENSNGLNVLAFKHAPGAKFTTKEDAERIAAEWNSGR